MHYVFGKINYGGLKHNSLYLGASFISLLESLSIKDHLHWRNFAGDFALSLPFSNENKKFL